MNKAIYILILPSIMSLVFYACDFGSGTSGYATDFRIDSLKLTVGNIETRYSNYYELVALDSSKYDDTLSYDIGFEIRIAKTTYITENHQSEFGIINSAMADPIPPSSISKPTLISIYSNKELHANSQVFETGESLSSLFEGYYDWGEWGSVIQTTENVQSWYDYSPILFRMKSAPDSLINQAFTFKVTMDDGVIFEMTSPDLIIK